MALDGLGDTLTLKARNKQPSTFERLYFASFACSIVGVMGWALYGSSTSERATDIVPTFIALVFAIVLVHGLGMVFVLRGSSTVELTLTPTDLVINGEELPLDGITSVFWIGDELTISGREKREYQMVAEDADRKAFLRTVTRQLRSRGREEEIPEGLTNLQADAREG